MDLEHAVKWLLLGVLALTCAVFAGAETSLFALSPLERLRLKERHPRSGDLVESLLSRPRRLLTTILLGVESISILASVLATSVALDFWGPRGKWLALWVVAPLFLLVGEIIPKSLALAYPTRLARWLAPLMRLAMFLFAPFRVAALQVSRGILATLGFRTDLHLPTLHQEDFVHMVEESHSSGMIAALERDFIHNLLSLGEIRVGQIMVPRPDIFSLPVDLPLNQMIQSVKRSRFSRIPLYRDDPGNIVGILYAKDLLSSAGPRPSEGQDILNLLRPPHYVPESKGAFDLLTELQARHLRLVLVVDEYGSLVGLVSVEDVLEELCGEISQEFKEETHLLEEVAPQVFRVKATFPLAGFNEALNLDLPHEDYDTIGGLVLNLFGEFPREGDEVGQGELTFKVLKTKGTRLLDLEVRREAAP